MERNIKKDIWKFSLLLGRCLAGTFPLYALALLFFSSRFAVAYQQGHEVGNGGGAWVCRENNGDIRWAKLVDLFEAESEFGLTIPIYPGTYKDIVDALQLRLSKVDRELHQGVLNHLGSLNYLENAPPQVIHVAEELEVIQDALYRIKPGAKRCIGGTIAYEQLVNYKNDGQILVQSDLFVGKNAAKISNLSEVAKAALVFHEAIYEYRREAVGEKNSVMSRRIVGLLFSALSVGDLTKELEKLGVVAVAGMSFAKISSDGCMMGASEQERKYYGRIYGRDLDLVEFAYYVKIPKPFAMMKTEVTQSQWFAIMGGNPSRFSSYENCPDDFIAPEKNNGVALCPNNPVDTVSWNDTRHFLVKLNRARKDGYLYRLPTEAEWECAIRGGTAPMATFFWGDDDEKKSSAFAWHNLNSDNMTHEVTKLQSNWFGLYDMAGNVAEWVSDYWSNDYGGHVNGGPARGSMRVLRGGNWRSHVIGLRSASRGFMGPSHRDDTIGFRLAREPLVP